MNDLTFEPIGNVKRHKVVGSLRDAFVQLNKQRAKILLNISLLRVFEEMSELAPNTPEADNRISASDESEEKKNMELEHRDLSEEGSVESRRSHSLEVDESDEAPISRGNIERLGNVIVDIHRGQQSRQQRRRRNSANRTPQRTVEDEGVQQLSQQMSRATLGSPPSGSPAVEKKIKTKKK